MHETHPITRTLLAALENQQRRTEAALEGLQDDVFTADPGGGCNSIRDIGRHLIQLRRFQLLLMNSPRVADVPDHEAIESIDALRAALTDAADAVARGFAEHDPDDWFAVPDPPREGMWGEDPTLLRVMRPFNDFVNHLGSIRAIRRIMSNANERTQ